MKKKEQVMTLIMIVILLTGCNKEVIAQRETIVKSEGCKAIDGRELPQNIKVDILNNKNEVVFRLTNNCTCSIFVEVDKPYVKGDPQPQFHYYLKNRNKLELPVKGYNWDQSENLCEIEPGEHMFFEVPLKIIEKNYDLLVPFRYSWEIGNETNKTSIVHQIIFSTEAIPKTIKERMKKLRELFQ